jgi:hypothetical protein
MCRGQLHQANQTLHVSLPNQGLPELSPPGQTYGSFLHSFSSIPQPSFAQSQASSTNTFEGRKTQPAVMEISQSGQMLVSGLSVRHTDHSGNLTYKKVVLFVQLLSCLQVL